MLHVTRKRDPGVCRAAVIGNMAKHNRLNTELGHLSEGRSPQIVRGPMRNSKSGAIDKPCDHRRQQRKQTLTIAGIGESLLNDADGRDPTAELNAGESFSCAGQTSTTCARSDPLGLRHTRDFADTLAGDQTEL